ncbi:MAG: hypothetical protein ACOCUU_03820 [Nanoarchaeota archaeon]
MRWKNFYLILIFVFGILLTSNLTLAYSNESIQTKETILEAESAMKTMINKSIPVNRVNESLQESKHLYELNFNFEKNNRKYDYDLALEKAENVIFLKDLALQAQDDLNIFLNIYNESSQDTNLSDMDKTYNEIVNSFKEERFEETIKLIDKGYTHLSEVQARQTTFNAFYENTSKNLKDFLLNNWLKILIGFVVFVLGSFVFGSALSKLKIRAKLKALEIKKKTIKNMLKQAQYRYFQKRDISENEYRIKIQRFSEMTRDVERQIPLLKEQLMKTKSKNKKKDLKKSKQDLKKKVKKEKKDKEKANKKIKELAKKEKKEKKKNAKFFGLIKKKQLPKSNIKTLSSRKKSSRKKKSSK